MPCPKGAFCPNIPRASPLRRFRNCYPTGTPTWPEKPSSPANRSTSISTVCRTSARIPSSNPTIPLRLEYPKIGRIDDAEIVGDRIAEDSPVFRHLLAQETQNGITEIVVGRVAPIVRHVSMHQPP